MLNACSVFEFEIEAERTMEKVQIAQLNIKRFNLCYRQERWMTGPVHAPQCHISFGKSSFLYIRNIGFVRIMH